MDSKTKQKKQKKQKKKTKKKRRGASPRTAVTGHKRANEVFFCSNHISFKRELLSVIQV